MSVKRTKAEYIIGFAIGILFLVLGIYGIYYLLAVELPSGYFSRLPFAAVACIILGVVIIRLTYPIFIPLKPTIKSVACPFCGAMVEETAAFCEKCKRQLEN